MTTLNLKLHYFAQNKATSDLELAKLTYYVQLRATLDLQFVKLTSLIIGQLDLIGPEFQVSLDVCEVGLFDDYNLSVKFSKIFKCFAYYF